MTNQKAAVVPETLEGWAVLHEVFHVNWASWNALPAPEQSKILAEASEFFTKASRTQEGDSACFSLIGHKGDLLFLHFRSTLDDLNAVELGFRRCKLAQYLRETTSYISYVELGLYEMTVKLHQQLLDEGLEPESDEWNQKWQAAMSDQKERVKNRIYTKIPDTRYLCFYPMDKKRGESKNWYDIPIEERQRMMRDHGMIGRKYGGRVTQIIAGSIGFDDWEWGVYLFAKDPIVFKKLIYEMRFDEASAHYALFGPFYSALRFQPENLKDLFAGKSPC